MKDFFTKKWIIENAVTICNNYEFGVLTLRGLHYQLVNLGMTNDLNHYKRVVNAMIQARWEKVIPFEQFSDLDRQTVSVSEHEHINLVDEIVKAKEQIKLWMTTYRRNKWENQEKYVEVLIEKKALQGVFEPICNELKVYLGACKGYPSLTFIHDMAIRLSNIKDKKKVLLYFGDYDPSGEDIPRSIIASLKEFGINVELIRVALSKEQVIDYNLPFAPVKVTDTRSLNWNGLGQVELDSLKPEVLRQLCFDSINMQFDDKTHHKLIEIEEKEKSVYISLLKEYVKTL